MAPEKKAVYRTAKSATTAPATRSANAAHPVGLGFPDRPESNAANPEARRSIAGASRGAPAAATSEPSTPRKPPCLATRRAWIR